MVVLLWLFATVSILSQTTALDTLPNLFNQDALKKMGPGIGSDDNIVLQDISSDLNLQALSQLNNISLDLTNFDLFKKQKTFTEMANEINLTVDEYSVVTEDGYILTVFYVKGNKTVTNARNLLVMHGILDSADTFILRGELSLVNSLIEAGYGVWLGTSRGSRYARKHTTLDPDKDDAYWDFTFHEMGVYDLPATIDFIGEKSGNKKISYIGHSQGNQILWVLGSEKPEYIDIIDVGIALAPICFLQNLQKSLLQVVLEIAPLLILVVNVLNINELVNDRGPIRTIEQLICGIPEVGYAACLNGIINPVGGADNEQIEKHFFTEKVIRHYPSSTSVKNLIHYYQLNKRKEYAQFNYSPTENIKRYGSLTPPRYKLEQVTMPVALLQGDNDLLASNVDTDLLNASLPNVILYKKVERPETTHSDFIWGRNAKDYVHNVVLDVLSKYN